MMTNDRAMLDANLLVYAFYPKEEFRGQVLQ